MLCIFNLKGCVLKSGEQIEYGYDFSEHCGGSVWHVYGRYCTC